MLHIPASTGLLQIGRGHLRQSQRSILFLTGQQPCIPGDPGLVELKSPEIPKYRKALEGIYAKLNTLTIHFPGTHYHIKFAVAGTEVHTKPHNSVTPMS